ncbi:MAG: LacI family DNA-binding transcriptional regulator [Chitinophagaceae bacterium]|nr:LacI family DNA-binding transcriptional regulator [Rubrivivax sp.]
MAETPRPVNTKRRNSSAPTSAAVAERAGVSRTTVSFVLNDVRSMNISEATRQKVLDAARDLGYEPHAAARSLAGGSTGTVAVLIPRSEHLHVDAFLPRLLSAVNDRCHAYGCKVLLEVADDLGKVPGAFMNLVRGKRVDGLVIANMRAGERPFVEQLAREGFPVVVPGNSVEPFHSRGGKGSDVPLAQEITRHLMALGHRRIAHIPFAPQEFEVVALRRAGYEKALRLAGIEPDPALLAHGDVSAQSGYEAMKAILERKAGFTALFAGNDTIAFGAIRALYEAGLSVPADVAVVGYDDVPLAAFACPSLTTMQTDPITRGHEAVDMLHGLMSGQPYKRQQAPYSARLIVRESCGSLPPPKAVSAPRKRTSAKRLSP